MQLHDLVIRTIAVYTTDDNMTLVRLMQLNKRFYDLREVFVRHICLKYRQSEYAYKNRPYGWNKVHTFMMIGFNEKIDFTHFANINTFILADCINPGDISALKKVKHLIIYKCRDTIDVSALGSLKSIHLQECDNISKIEALRTVKYVSIDYCYDVRDVSALTKVPYLYLKNLNIINSRDSFKNKILSMKNVWIDYGYPSMPDWIRHND